MECPVLPNDILDCVVNLSICDTSKMRTLKSTFAYVFRTYNHIRPVRLHVNSNMHLNSMCTLCTEIIGQHLLYTIRSTDQNILIVDMFFAYMNCNRVIPHSLTFKLFDRDGRIKARHFIHGLDFDTSEFYCVSSFASLIQTMHSSPQAYISIHEFVTTHGKPCNGKQIM